MIRREQLEAEIAQALPAVAVGADRAAADVPARDRHADRRRAVRRDRRLPALPAPRAGDELSRRRAVRALLRRAAPARARSRSPAASTPAGCWSRRPGTTAARRGSPAASRAASATASPRSSRSPGRRSDGSTTSGRGWSSATSAARSSPSPPRASSPASAGRSPPPNEPHRHTRWSGGAAGAGPSRRASVTHYGQPTRRSVTPVTRRRALRRNPVLRYPTRAYQADRASRTRPARRPPDQQKRPATRAFRAAHLTKRRPYQVSIDDMSA